MCRSAFVLYFFILVFAVDSARVRQHSTGKQAIKFLRGIGVHKKSTSSNGGLWPSVFNVATKALITANATCGQDGREEFCRIAEGSSNRGRCGICDGFSPDPGKQHPISNAIDDGTNRWWQSPPLYYGCKYEYVTITLDLKQVYQVAYVIIKAANSPRPGAWVLERSIDGENYDAWQYFATSDKDCMDRYGIPARKGKPHYFTDSEVICTSFYSKLMPTENGEIHTFLIHGRPGANETSPELLEFTKARYVRLRLQGLRGSVDPLPAWLSQDIAIDKRLYYSIRDISIGGQCVCNGHAASCRHNVASGHPECECAHHTTGSNCDRCSPLFNQRPWGAGTSRDGKICLPCNCHKHAKSCHYDENVDKASLSMDINGHYQGGGVCDNCTDHTTGINCEKCSAGYYRPAGVRPDSEIPCLQCDCDALGSTGDCDVVGSNVRCECRPGFGGLRCDSCADGYRGYPDCELCPCDSRGVLNQDCDGECLCKANVDGKFCDHCKVGYFALLLENPEGCSSCYCSGATTVCTAAHIPTKQIKSDSSWLISDISVTEFEEPTLDEYNRISVGNYEIPGIEAYYWLAPTPYLGNKLYAYGSELIFKAHWVVMRGDTSGKPTTGPNIIIVGANGMRIASGDDLFTGTNMTFRIKLAEYDKSWYHVPNDVKDIVTRLRRMEYKGDFVTRAQFLSVLTDVKYILLRAKFHTDQIEGSLEEAVIHVGDFKEGYSPVEECSCPSGYTGLSCESCQYGYVRIISNNTAHQEIGFCAKCDCNGHSNSCNLDTGECSCEHNTIGETCERCAPGYYGNPLLGTPKDCKKCACPLEEEENNFSPSCQLDSSSLSNDDDEPGYVCTQCPKGYTGDHCEICDDGYYGVPSQIGGRCEPCTCGGGPCDRITGQCLGCRGNTEGWRCERCKEGFYGDPVIGCERCLCDPQGSIKPNCNNVTGECECKEHFIGRTCNKCEIGYGNVTAQCTPCTCNLIGSRSNICDPHSGLCDCHPGVEGFRCDACQHLHYGFSTTGCQSCKCNTKGSLMSTCDIKTGQCRCKQNYIGRSCDQCEAGYWNATESCEKCNCDPDGSSLENCDQTSGNCLCKPGVQGKRCDSCKPLHYGFSNTGCKACEICNKKGHICHPETGRCVCPPNSHGASCHLCTTNTWGHEPGKGCKKCECSATGSVRLQCNLQTGECQCQKGYVGEKCDKCDHGYYGYPKCRRCNCDLHGTDRQLGNCTVNGICQCNSDGSCPCKKNVKGRLCNTCKEGNFGLHAENPDGCTECFCFNRSKKCQDSGYSWTKIRTPPRNLTISFTTKRNKRQISNDIIDINNFEEIPSSPMNITRTFDDIYIPLFWKLPKIFYGDRILSYSGHLRFTTSTNGTNLPINNMFSRYPLVRLEGNGFKLIYHLQVPPINNKFEVRLHESLWKRIHSDSSLVTRELLMLTLQNVTGIYIKASDFSVFEHIILTEVSLDSATDVAGRIPPLAQGIEKCFCDTLDNGDFKYNGTSCQNPGRGFYRHKPNAPANHHIINIEDIIGKSVRCKCNKRTSTCDIETGHCLGCKENTTGNACERCAEGFYGDPMKPHEKCKPCSCPSVRQNFAKSCTPSTRFNKYMCVCKTGYTGPTCNTCSPEYYGQPHLPNGSCKPCNCDSDGSINNICDPITGHCNCKKGITGTKCSKCEESRHILENNKCTRCDDCIQMLLDDIESMSYNLMNNTSHLQNGTLSPPWGKLNSFKKRHIKLSDLFEDYDIKRDKLYDFIDNKDIDSMENNLKNLNGAVDKQVNLADPLHSAAEKNQIKAKNIGKEIQDNKKVLNGILDYLYDFGNSKVNTHEALEKGKEMLKDIKNKYMELDNRKIESSKVYKHCKKINDWAERIINNNKVVEPSKLKKEIKSLLNRYKDLENILDGIEKRNAQFVELNAKNADDYVRIAEKLAKLETDHEEIQELIKKRKEEFNQTFELLNNIEKRYDAFTEELDELHKLNEDLKKKNKDLDLGINTLNYYKNKIDAHVYDLEKNISDYNRIFNFTSKELDAFKASERFSVIKETLEEANKTLYEAMQEFEENVKTNLNPEGTDSIYDKTAIANANSDRLIKRVEHLQNQIKQALSKLHRQIPDIEGNNWRNGINNNAVTERVIQLIRDNKSRGDIEAIIEGAKRSTIEMRGIYKEVTNINISMQHELLKKHQKCLNLTSPENVRMTENDIDFVTKLLQNASKAIETINMENVRKSIKDQKNIENDRFVQNKLNLEENLKHLRALVMKTQQVAATISVALTGDSCSRTYKVKDLEPTTFTKINVQFTYGGKPGDLFTIKNSKQYMNLRVEKHKVVLMSKFDKIDHNISIPITNSDMDINIERMNNILSLEINNEKKRKNMEDTPLIFNVNSNDLLRVGMDTSNKVTGIPGCLKQIAFNNRMIGLWEFEKSIGNCAACSKNNTIIVGPVKYRFNGKGYAMTKIEKVDVTRFNIKLNCKTFDENALIFLAYHDKTYLAITLQNGKIAFEMVYKNQQLQPISGISEEKYNNGKEFSIELSKLYNKSKKTDLMTFKINDVTMSGEFVAKHVNSNDILKIKKANLNFGGIPPDVPYIDEFKKYPNFLGILSEVSSENAINLQDTQNYGISFSADKDIEYRTVLFEQNGYLTMKPNITITKLNNSIDFSFVLRTEIENGFVLSLVDENNDLVVFEIESGMLQVSQPKSTKLVSNEKINDDQFYLVHLSKRNKNATLSINGIEQMRTKVQSSFSGKPITLNIGGLPNKTNFFKGVIKDIVINNKLLTVNAESYVTAEGVMIGRSKRETAKPKREEENYEDNNTIMENVTMKDMQQIDGCDKINYSLEPNAVKFGDAPNSYVKRSIKENFWKRDFSIDFEFRSFYKNGVLFLAQGSSNDYYLLQIKGGKVELHINGKRRKNIQSNVKIDDGNWHQVSIQCTAKNGRNKKKLMIMAVDGDVQKVKVPPNKVSGNLFFGDIDKNEKKILDKLDPFRGCIRALKINNAPQDLINDKNTVQYYNIGQCFPNIERGSYFRGDSYALYNSLFRLSNSLEFSFNFRTSEQNGILLSVSNMGNSPALSIELQNGAVVMSVDMGSGTPTKVTNNLPKYTICNNKWHHVSAKLSTELTVIVDGVEKSWVLSEMGFAGIVEAPLYIGGLPDSEPAGTLKIRENFKGCINNLTIGNVHVDWINMEDLYSVALNSCPVIL